MHILQINNNHRIVGGSDNVYLRTGKLLESNNHSVSYFAAKSDSDEPCKDSSLFCEGLDTKTARTTDALRFLQNNDAKKALNNLLNIKQDIDVAHLHIYYGRLTPAILRPLKEKRVPIVQTLHEYKSVCPTYTMERAGTVCSLCVTGSSFNCIKYRCKNNSLSKSSLIWLEHNLSIMRGSLQSVHRFICVSDFQRNIMIRGGIPAEKLSTLHNFVDFESLQPQSIQRRESYLLYYGRIEKLKGLQTLLDAASKTGAELKIAGEGAWSQELRNRILKMPNVEYLGFISGNPLRELVQKARAVIVPSEWYETFGLTAAEAKAIGTPVIASRIGGLTEVVRDGIDGILFEPGSSDDLSRAIDALTHIDLENMGEAGKLDVIKRFSPHAHLTSLQTIYRETIASVNP